MSQYKKTQFYRDCNQKSIL